MKKEFESEWIDYPTAERITSLSHTTLWRYVSRGDVKSARVGRSVRIHLPSLKAFMEERSSGGDGEHAPSKSDSF